jgi:phenylalanyl-tRNA synthetase beta chain
MKVSLDWLSTHIDLGDRDVSALCDALMDAGVEVEEVERRGVSSDRVVVARICEAAAHPNADRLKVTQVDAGEGSLRQIVCGARNYKVGDKVPCALPGARLPGGFTIGETVMRKVESRGMLCSAEEIGLPAGEDGLLILPEDAEIGVPLARMYGSDTVLTLEVTPNRPDLLSHRGMARELAALLAVPLRSAEEPMPETSESTDIRIDAPDACPFYSAVRIDGVKVAESPAWMRKRLEAVGLRPINNIVDVTNFVLHETGQPLHAFDAAHVRGGIVVRHAAAGEEFEALDGNHHKLAEGDLAISDGAGSVLALAGVMGGLASGVTDATTSVILESAYFAPQGVRRTARRCGISTDSSYRFERGVDPAAVLGAAAMALRLILEVAGGRAEPRIRCRGRLPDAPAPVRLDNAALDQLTGASVSADDAASILTRLGLRCLGDGRWQVPSHRADLVRHIDLVEEIVRVHGLSAIPSRREGIFVASGETDRAYDADMVLRRRLAATGFFECQTIKLIAMRQLPDALPLRPLQEGDLVCVRHPLSEDHAVMRPSIVPGLVASAAHNVAQQARGLRLFEAGRVFRNSGGGRAKDQEGEVLSLLLSGEAEPEGWNRPERTADLYDLKGVLAALLPGGEIRFVPREREGFVLVCDIRSGERNLGIFARLSPARERALGFIHPVYVAELDLPKLRGMVGAGTTVADLPQFPGSSRDAAMDVPAGLPNAAIEEIIAKCAEPLLVSASCFDVFRDPAGGKLPADRKSLAYRFLYRAADRTLTSAEVDAAHGRVLEALGRGLDLSFR